MVKSMILCINKLSQEVVNLLDSMAWPKFTKRMSRCDLFVNARICLRQNCTKSDRMVICCWGAFVEECQINFSTPTVCKSLESVQLDDDEVMLD